ncbi:MAG: zinc ABC transporter substrate-binding protein [Atopobiaceae bacterium]|nr:zinc ABC transporter substrate-binding protein [Atopobiaceae bacterium]
MSDANTPNLSHPSRRQFLAAGLAAAGSALLAGCAGSGPAAPAGSDAGSDAGIKVIASFYVMGDFAKKVGGDLVSVTDLVPAGTEPHDWEPSPRDIEDLQAADLFVYNGAGMEHWVEDVVSDLDTVKVVEASKGIELLDGEHGHDHDHDGHDPHVWLAPANAKMELAAIRDGLVAVDPEHTEQFDAAYEEHARAFDELDQEFRTALESLPNKTIVVSHAAYGYLCDAYGLTQRAITGIDAEGEPDARTMAEIIDFVKESGIKTIFTEELVSPKVAQAIADATGASCQVLNPIEGLTQEQERAGEDYLSLMRQNLKALVAALG